MKRCKVCRQPFEPRPPRALVCSEDCAGAFAVSKRLKEERRAEKAAQALERKDTKARKERLKSLSQLAKEAEREVNRYVRARDFKEGCISCDKPATWQGQWHASHFRSVGAASQLRFNLWNIHKACSVCNNHLSGNIRNYESRLKTKIGDEKHAFLLEENSCKKYNRDYLVRLKRVFSRKARRQEIRNEKIDC